MIRFLLQLLQQEYRLPALSIGGGGGGNGGGVQNLVRLHSRLHPPRLLSVQKGTQKILIRYIMQ
jgi:hypothetical protein